MDKGCTACHNGINIGGGRYAPFGVVEKPDASLLPPGDAGRFEVTKAVGDLIVSFLDSLTGQQPSVVFPTLPPNVTSSPHPDQ
jgi:cytochrome c peroxidase